jgi:hypothetical protein
MRLFMATLLILFLNHLGFSEDKNPLRGLEAVYFTSYIKLHGEALSHKEFEKELGDRAEKALKEAGIIRESKDASCPHLHLVVQGSSTKGVVFLHWELQLKEDVEIPANDTYRHEAFHGKAGIWRAEGIATAFPDTSDKKLIECIDKVLSTFIKHWRLGNPTKDPPEATPTDHNDEK